MGNGVIIQMNWLESTKEGDKDVLKQGNGK